MIVAVVTVMTPPVAVLHIAHVLFDLRRNGSCRCGSERRSSCCSGDKKTACNGAIKRCLEHGSFPFLRYAGEIAEASNRSSATKLRKSAHILT